MGGFVHALRAKAAYIVELTAEGVFEKEFLLSNIMHFFFNYVLHSVKWYIIKKGHWLFPECVSKIYNMY